MATPGIDPSRAERYKREIEGALRDGYFPFRGRKTGKGAAIEEAARRIAEAGHEDGHQRKIANRIYRWVVTNERRKARGDSYLLPDWNLYAEPGKPAEAVSARKIERWILTAAQDDTDVHPKFWVNLKAYAAFMDAQIVVAGFTYQHLRHTDRTTLTSTYRPEVRDYLRFDPYDCGPILFAAEMNTLPTAVRPISDLHAYGRGRTTIFPHVKHQLESVAVAPGAEPVQVLTTGACTVPNYIEKKAGQKARFHHILGAVIVEVTSEGAWHRHISAEQDGTFQDLTNRVKEGQVSTGCRIEALTPGDVHAPYYDDAVVDMIWGRRTDSIVDELRPRMVFLHDLTDFRPINRHTRNDPFHKARMAAAGEHRVEDHLAVSAAVCRAAQRDENRIYVVGSNHPEWLHMWAADSAAHNDPVNAIYWHRCNLALREAIAEGDDKFDLYHWALRAADPYGLEGVELLPIGASHVILRDRGGGIECAFHGHLGPHGSKGTVHNLARGGARVNMADKHAPAIFEGAFCAGISCYYDQVYNRSPTGWALAHIVTYPSGKRCLVFQNGKGRWRA